MSACGETATTDRIPEPCLDWPSGQEARRLPLWLTREEAETLLFLCLASPGCAGDREAGLFARLGEHLRAFSR